MISNVFCSLILLFIIIRIKNNISKSNKERLKIKDIKPGSIISIELKDAVGFICNVKCMSNDIREKKILIEIRWSGLPMKKEKRILKYNSQELKHFHLLNSSIDRLGDKEDDDFESNEGENKAKVILDLQKKLQKCIKEENYEQADEIQKKINFILKENDKGDNI